MNISVQSESNLKNILFDYLDFIFENNRRITVTWDESTLSEKENSSLINYMNSVSICDGENEYYANGMIDVLSKANRIEYQYYDIDTDKEGQSSDGLVNIQKITILDSKGGLLNSCNVLEIDNNKVRKVTKKY